MLVDSDLDEDELMEGSDDLIGCSQESDDSDLDADGDLDDNEDSPTKKKSTARKEIEVEKKVPSDIAEQAISS